jgi:protease-4
VDMQGVIASDSMASADNLIPSLQDAFGDKNTKGVILRINSPGGSPVQAGQINDEIRRLRAKYPKIPLYVVVDDICASGGYYVAVAADKIFVDKASLIGSIGVLMDGFGFTGTMAKLGVERRLITAGANKGFLDPFSPLNPAQKAYAKQMVEEIHQQFIDVVRKGRGNRLKETPDTFSGLVWNGQRGVEMGLADGFGTVESVARDVIKAEDIVDYTTRENLADRLAKRFGVGVMSALGISTQSSRVSLR